MMLQTFLFWVPLLASAVQLCSADGGALLDVYSSKEAPPRRPSGVMVQSLALRPAACVDAAACMAQCSADQLLNQDPTAVQAQVCRSPAAGVPNSLSTEQETPQATQPCLGPEWVCGRWLLRS